MLTDLLVQQIPLEHALPAGLGYNGIGANSAPQLEHLRFPDISCDCELVRTSVWSCESSKTVKTPGTSCMVEARTQRLRVTMPARLRWSLTSAGVVSNVRKISVRPCVGRNSRKAFRCSAFVASH